MKLVHIFCLLCMSAMVGHAEEWELNIPPSGVKRIKVDADWRPYDEIELTIQRLTGVPKGEVQCSLFFETKQDWWFESQEKLDLSEPTQTFRLSLKEGSADWDCSKIRRGYGPDVLRWVRNWGLKVFTDTDQQIRLSISELKLVQGKSQAPTISGIEVPRTAAVGVESKVRFRISGPRTNAFSAESLRGTVTFARAGTSLKRPIYFRQDFTTFRSPWADVAETLPMDLPVWQADWTPPAAGTYEVTCMIKTAKKRIARRLGSVVVTRVELDPPTASAIEPGYVYEYAGAPVYQLFGDDWMYPEPGLSFDKYLHAQLDWTPKWGNYTGLGEFDQLIAWRLEKQAKSLTQPMPLLAFSEDELDNRGTFNWKDHPLNEENRGDLYRPADFFAEKRAREIILDRARYLWARYGNNPNISGLLFLVNRPQDQAVTWLKTIASTLRSEFPNIRILSNNPGLPGRSRIEHLDLTEYWETDKRLSRFSFISRDSKRRQVQLEGRYPGTAAITSHKTVQHWAGAEVFSVDVENSEAAGNEVKAMCFLRTSSELSFQSKLVWLREDDWNRLYFPLNDPSFWECIGSPDTKLQAHDLLNVREVALRFFCDDPNEVILTVKNPHLLYPTVTACEEREPLAATMRTQPQAEVNQFTKFQLEFDLNRIFRNPYDENEIRVDLELTSPDGSRLIQPAFYYEPWHLKLEKGAEVPFWQGEPHWRARVTPEMTGTYKWKLSVVAEKETVAVDGEFVCLEDKDARGFVRISSDPRLFEFQNGEFYFPIGHNLRSPSDRRPRIYQGKSLANADEADKLGTEAYVKWFAKMKDNGENFTRLWMCPWWTGLEWNATAPGFHGVGFYNQRSAARLDKILEEAERQGIYINLETANHGMLSTHIDADWEHNPYSVSQPGGFLKYSTDFYSSEKARRLHLRKLRYVVARWGYSTAVALWGTMTEVEWTEAYFRGLGWVSDRVVQKKKHVPRPYKSLAYRDSCRDWLSQMGQYLKKTGANRHLATSHFSNPQNGLKVWPQEGNDVVHNNAYTNFASFHNWQPTHFRKSKGVMDVMYVAGNFFRRFNKPLILGEWGGHPTRNTEKHLLAELHTGTWAMFMAETAGVTGYWWWNLLDAEDGYKHFKAVAEFAAGEDRRGKKYRSTRAALKFTKKLDDKWKRSGLVLSNEERLFAYICNASINTQKTSLLPTDFNDGSFPGSGKGELAVPSNMKDGTYQVEYWNTFEGKVIETVEVTVANGKGIIPIIDHRVDLALKMKKM